jgi:hypothetical protein
VTSIYAGEHGQEHDGNPKMPGEPPRVQPSKKVAANWDDEGNPVSGDTDRKKT